MSDKMQCPVCEELDKIDTEAECYLCHGFGEIGVVELDACPLCGDNECWFGADIVIDDERKTVIGFIRIYCPGCETWFDSSHCHPFDAAQAFNHRPTESAMQAEVERLNGVIAGLKRPGMDTLEEYLKFHANTSKERLIEDMWRRDNEFVGLQNRVRELEGLVTEAYGVAFDSPELNMSNYDHNQVAELNDAMCEVCSILEDFQPTETAGEGEEG